MDLPLQLCFVAGAFVQTFLMLRIKGIRKRILILIAVWIVTVGWLFFITRTGSSPAQQPRILIFGVLFWAVMAGIAFVKQWAVKPDRGLLILHALTLAYAFSIPGKMILFLAVSGSLSLFIILTFRYLKERSMASRLLRYIFYFGSILIIAVLAFRFGDLYLLIDPGRPITMPWHSLFVGGMFFFYVGVHVAILFSFWSLSWSAMLKKDDTLQRVDTPENPSVEGILESIDTEGKKSSTSWVVPAVAGVLYTTNMLFRYLPHATLLPIAFVALPELVSLFSKKR